MISLLQKRAKKNLKSAGLVGPGTAPAILRIRELLDQKNLWLKITSGLNIYFTQSMKKSPKPIKSLEGMYSLKRLSEII